MRKKIIVLFLMMSFSLIMFACQLEQSNTTEFSQLGDENKYYGDVFGQGEITEINIEIDENDWIDLVENAQDEMYYSANITINGNTLNEVGIRAKGFSSLISVASSDSERYGFRVNFDKYVDNQNFNGLDTLVLNASYADPSYMREYLTYAASTYLGAITPYLSYTKLSINGEFFGLYLAIEAYDDSFVERYTDANDTVLYKANSDNCNLTLNDDGSEFDVKYGKDNDYSHIRNLISVLDQTTEENKEELEEILNVDSVLKAIALNTVVGNYDSYNGSKAHNYYLLYENGKFSYIGWDYNMSMGGFTEDNGASVTVDINEPVYNVNLSERPLIEKLLAIDEYKSQYLEYINSLVDYFDGFETQVDEIAQMIRDYVESDPTAFYTIEDFDSNIVKSDADLTQVQTNIPNRGGNQPPQMLGEGQPSMLEELPHDIDGQLLERPEGENQPPQMFDEEQPSMSGEGAQMIDGQLPKLPEGETIPKPNDPPAMPYGKNDKEGERLSPNTVSIIDYMTQRIENINKQLSDLKDGDIDN